MVTSYQTNRLSAFAVVKPQSSGEALEILEVKFLNEVSAKRGVSEMRKVAVESYDLLGEEYPENCGDKVRVTQELVIVVCTKNGHIVILRRFGMEPIVVVEGAGESEASITGEDIVVMEFSGQTSVEEQGQDQFLRMRGIW